MNNEKRTDAAPLMPLQESHIREFLANGVITRVTASGKADGFELHVLIGGVVGALVNARGKVRRFRSLNTLAGLLQRLGATEFDVSIGTFSSDEISAASQESKDSSQT